MILIIIIEVRERGAMRAHASEFQGKQNIRLSS